MSPQKVVLASNNAGKLKEFSAILSAAGLQMIAQSTLGVPEADEPHMTFVENALAKARHASRLTGLPALADDSGLSVDALNGDPGVYSARYAAMAGGERSDAANNRHLVSQLEGIANTSARYVAVLVYLRAFNDPTAVIAHGFWQGEIISTPEGAHGFGYDPHFYLPDLGQTAAELEPAQKNAVSHRGRALQELLQALRTSGH
jgi:XTP/dITP diphosphohydrolase